MRNSFWIGVAALAALTAPAWGDVVTFNNFGAGAGGYSAYGASPGGRGGEFVVTANGLGTFKTFCIELNEQIVIGGTYNYALNNEAVNGGAGGPSPDPLSPQSAYLYYHYRLGDLDTLVPGFNYNSNASADALQYAIWYLEQEVSNLRSATLTTDLLNFANSTSWTGIGPVRVMNLTYNGQNYQDQLALIPVPGAALLGVAGLGVVGWVRRKLA